MAKGNPIMRKVQKLGASSLIVTLPRDWTRRHRVNVGEVVYIYDEGDKLVISPQGRVKPAGLTFKLHSSILAKHMGKICLCAYLFGFDGVHVLSSSPIKEPMLRRIESILSSFADGRIEAPSPYEVLVEYGEPGEDAISLLASLGKSAGALLGRLARDLASGSEIDVESYEEEYRRLMELNYRLLRSTSTLHTVSVVENRLHRIVQSVSSVIGLIADASYKLALDVATLRPRLAPDEAERLSFLLQILEVAVATIASSIEPPSVKKAEEAYWKIRQILEFEGNLADIIEGGSNAFAYLLGKIIDLARLAEVAELGLLCYTLIRKYNLNGSAPDNGRQ